ncbi:phosphotransferase family protein [Halosolutus gelatinilyticus]|uniref:phosphotransferase family protein n=1 Tax=Halosolutus gelatinilyticus TaxID=2931975 RepID=UPI001FF69741|nr:phosphotransferase family protein [Halosolutus gelatinilyticus]
MTQTGANVDFERLESYLTAELCGGVTDIEVLDDGLNLHLAISTAEDGRTYVLRRPTKLRRTELFNDLEREYELLQRLRRTAIPAPEPVLFCDDDSIVGDAFFVTPFLDGAVIPLGSDLPDRFRTAPARRRAATLLIDTLAEIHSLDPEPFADVCERQPPRGQVDRAAERLGTVASVTDLDLSTLRSVGEWLRRNAPSDPTTTLVHGDFRPGNVLFAGTNRPEIAGVLDWETAILGDPLTELGYLLLRWRDEDDPAPPLDGLEARYPDSDAIPRLRAANERGLAPFTAKPGSPDRRELVARYEDATGIPFEDERFYRAHAAFTLATVWADLHRRRVEAGTESDWEPHVEYMSMVADGIVGGEFRL